MKKIVILLFTILLCRNFAICTETINLIPENTPDLNEEKILSSCPLVNTTQGIDEQFKDIINHPFGCLEGKELEAIRLDKGRTFIVRSQQPMSSDTPVGTLIDFESVGNVNIFKNKEPSEVKFTGEIIENKPPRAGGRSSTLKLEINKIKVDNVTYPATAYISKMGKKQIFLGVLAGAPIYLDNLADVADKGTVTIDKVYKDPCQYSCETIKSPLRPFYYAGGALLQVADLLLAPIVCFFLPGKEIQIPENTAFEIKLGNDVSLLKI